MSTEPTLLERLDRWFTIEQPVTYWSFWIALLRLVPVFLVLFGVVALAVGVRFATISFAPLPFVLIAATVGYAVRSFDATGGLISFGLAVIYAFVLWLTGVGLLMLRRPTILLSVTAILTFVALLAGFASPTLHGQPENEEFKEAHREYRQSD